MLSNSFYSIHNQMQTLADRMRKDIEKSLHRSFNTFDLLDYSSSLDPFNTWYNMRLKIDDGHHVRVETCRKEPGKNWDVCVKEFDKDRPSNAAIGQGKTAEPPRATTTSTSPSEQSKIEPLKTAETTTQSLDQYSPLQEMQTFANSIKKEVESILGRNFDMFDLFESTASLDPENTWYRMLIRVDDNGHLKVKTLRKDPGQDWDVRLEEFDRGQGIEQGRSEERGKLSSEESRGKLSSGSQSTQQGQSNQQTQPMSNVPQSGQTAS